MKIFQENNQPNGWNLEGVDLFGHESYGVEAGSSASLSITSAKEIEERFKRRIIKKLKLMKYKCDGWTWEDRAQQLIHRARQDRGYFLFGIGNSPYAYVVRLPMEWWDDVGGIFMIETRIRAPHFDVLYARLEARD